MFQNWWFCVICFYALLTDLLACTQTFYKLVGKGDAATSTKENVPILTQSFFTCGSNQDCTDVMKIAGKNEFKEVIGKQAMKEETVAYSKVTVPKSKGMFAFELVHCVNDKVSAVCKEFNKFMLTRKSYVQASIIGKGKISGILSALYNFLTTIKFIKLI